MRIEGLQFVLAELNTMRHDICPACKATLPPVEERPFTFTCNAECHAKWIDALIERHGPVMPITYSVTGKTYAVPTRRILETGISAKDLPSFPEVG